MAPPSEPVHDRRVVCVTGMHRSGTSLAAHAIGFLGVSLGEPDSLLEPGNDNTAGYWENAAIKQLDDSLLAELGGSWDEPPVLDPGWESSSDLDRLRERARRELENAFPVAAGGLVGWKDPRASLLLPFWRTVTGVDATIVVVRDPNEVADSLSVRNAMRSPQALLLWLRYLLAATSDDPRCLLVTYDSFFDDLDATLDRLADHMGVPAASAEQRAQVRASIDLELRHHAASSEVADSVNPFAEMAGIVWNGGDPDPGLLDRHLADAITRGWIRSPLDSAQLAEARASWVRQSETLRRRSDAWDHQKELWARQRAKSVQNQERWTRRRKEFEAERARLLEYYESPLQVRVRRWERRLVSVRRRIRKVFRR